MSQPPPYDRLFDFTGFSASSPSDQQPGALLDAEFNAIKTTIDAIRSNIARLQRDDGALANGSVNVEQLGADVVSFFSASTSWNLIGAWTTLHVYVMGDVVTKDGGTYLCGVAHTSGTFATDLAAGKWFTIFNASGTTPADGSVTTAKIADGAVTPPKIGFTALDLSSTIRAQAGLAAGSAVAGTHVIYGKTASGEVRAVMERATRTQGAVGYRWLGGSSGYNYELVQDSGADVLSFRLVGGAEICAFQTDGRADWQNTQRIVASSTFAATGVGLELAYNSSVAIVQGYNRTTSAYIATELRGSPLRLVAGGITGMTMTLVAGSPVADFTELTINGVSVGYRGVPQNAQNGNYTLVSSDYGKHIYSKNSGAQTITIPTNASVPYALGTAIQIINRGTTAITINAASVTLIWAGVGSTGNRSLGTGGLCTLQKVEADIWIISGAGLS